MLIKASGEVRVRVGHYMDRRSVMSAVCLCVCLSTTFTPSPHIPSPTLLLHENLKLIILVYKTASNLLKQHEIEWKEDSLGSAWLWLGCCSVLDGAVTSRKVRSGLLRTFLFIIFFTYKYITFTFLVCHIFLSTVYSLSVSFWNEIMLLKRWYLDCV